MPGRQKRIFDFFSANATNGTQGSVVSSAVNKKSSDHSPPGKRLKTDLVKTPPKSADNEDKKSKSLTPEQKERIEKNRVVAMTKLHSKTSDLNQIGATWNNELREEFKKPYFEKLMKFVADERKNKTIYPPCNEVFMWTRACEINEVKVIILGQDPYHGPDQAHGLCFSVKKGVKPPPSLENMYKELERSVDGFKHPGHGDLTGWAEQGVLLLNAVLTVEAHKANSHKDKGWEQFTDAVITCLNSKLSGAVFMLWGGYAQKKGKSIDKKKQHVLTSVHPSPLSAYRGFIGCNHFTEANKLLKAQGDKMIDWAHLP